MRFFLILTFCLISFCVASEAQAQCRGGSCRLAGVARAPARLVAGAAGRVKGLLSRTRFADGDGRILRRAN